MKTNAGFSSKSKQSIPLVISLNQWALEGIIRESEVIKWRNKTKQKQMSKQKPKHPGERNQLSKTELPLQQGLISHMTSVAPLMTSNMSSLSAATITHAQKQTRCKIPVNI